MPELHPPLPTVINKESEQPTCSVKLNSQTDLHLILKVHRVPQASDLLPLYTTDASIS